VASVVLGFRRADVAHPLDGFGMLIPEKEGFAILGALFSSSLFPQSRAGREVTITCYIGGARAPELPLKSPEELTEMAVQATCASFWASGAEPTFPTRHRLSSQAIPQYNLGFGKYRALMNDMELKAPGLFVAGHARDGISLGDSIVSGHNAAGRIQTYLGAPPEPVAAALHPITA
jgi:oxygen-dependent protoporphyrinogen oxidase